MFFKNLKVEFSNYLGYCRSLRFDDRPDYQYLRQLFRNLFHRQGFTHDYLYDWNKIKTVSSRFEIFLSQKKSNKSFFPIAGAEQFLFKEKGFKTF